MDEKSLISKIERSPFSRTEIAEFMGLTRQGLHSKLIGKREFKASEIKRLSDILGLTREEKERIFFADYVDKNAN